MGEVFAVPLTPAEVGLLVRALHEEDRLSGGGGVSRHQAYDLAKRAGVAAALGHRVVPQPVGELYVYDLVLGSLLRWAPDGPLTRQVELLLTRMHVLSGVARVRGWRAQSGAGWLCWHPGPPAPVEVPSLTDQ